MNWQLIEITLPIEQEEQVTDWLLDAGACSITTEAGDDSQVFEINGEAADSWPIIALTGMFDESFDLGVLAQAVTRQYDFPVRVKLLADQDWERAWLDHFKPVQISDRLWVVPSWQQPVDDRAINIRIDPGMSFGTGTHESTQLCLAWLDELDLTDHKVIDYGCGSGILAIAAARMGAKEIIATDIEPRSLAISIENAQLNHVADHIKTYLPADMPNLKANVVVANILATTIVSLKDRLLELLAEDGYLLLAGILKEQEALIKSAFPQLNWSVRSQNDWIAMLGRA